MDSGEDRKEHEFLLSGAVLKARASGSLWWPQYSVLAVSDLHLGRSERTARQGGAMLPPYDTLDTLTKLETEVAAKQPETVICLGDSFDDLAASEWLEQEAADRLCRLTAARNWIWIEGNHDPGPVFPTGLHLPELTMKPLTFRHIAAAGATGEISGHFHPKATIRTRRRTMTYACFLYDSDRVILPAFGTYTGGLRSTDPELAGLMGPDAFAVLTGRRARAMPFRKSTELAFGRS